MDGSHESFIPFDLPPTRQFIIVVNLSQFLRLIRLTGIGWSSSQLAYVAIAVHPRGERHTQRLAANIPFSSNGIVAFRYVIPPILQTCFHILPSHHPPLKVRLQSQRRCHGRSLRIGNVLILVRAAQRIAQPFVAPPPVASTVPQRSVALTSLPGHHAPKQRPAARHQLDRSTSHGPKSKRPAVERVGHYCIGIPRPTAAHAKAPDVRFVDFDPVGVYAIKGPGLNCEAVLVGRSVVAPSCRYCQNLWLDSTRLDSLDSTRLDSVLPSAASHT